MRVVFLTAILPQYRLPFHEGVRARLLKSGIQYDVIFGQPGPAEAAKADTEILPWGKQVINRPFEIGQFSAIWQPALQDIWASDLAVIGQENRFLINYVVQSLRGFCDQKLRFGAMEGPSKQILARASRNAGNKCGQREPTGGLLTRRQLERLWRDTAFRRNGSLWFTTPSTHRKFDVWRARSALPGSTLYANGSTLKQITLACM